MFKIGDFSKLNKISVKTLRYYEDLGLSLKEIANILDSKLCTDTVLSMLSIKEKEIK